MTIRTPRPYTHTDAHTHAHTHPQQTNTTTHTHTPSWQVGIVGSAFRFACPSSPPFLAAGLELRVQGSGFRVQGLGFRAWALAIRLWGVSFRLEHSAHACYRRPAQKQEKEVY